MLRARFFSTSIHRNPKFTKGISVSHKRQDHRGCFLPHLCCLLAYADQMRIPPVSDRRPFRKTTVMTTYRQARLLSLRIRNYRAIRDLDLTLTPLTVLLGPNGSGKSTIFDVLAFISECFDVGLSKAWDKRGRLKELRTRGAEGPITIEVQYQEPGYPRITYHLEISERGNRPVVEREWLSWRRRQHGKPFRFLDFERGAGRVWKGETPFTDEADQREDERLGKPDTLAVSTFGQLANHPRIMALKEFLTGWYISYLTISETRSQPDAGPQERLSRSGDNLPNVIQYLKEQHEDRLGEILNTLRNRVPRLESVTADAMPDNRLLLQIKDAPFDQPILAKYASDGTMKLLAYLMVLYDPTPPPIIGIEEPENHLHPRLLPELCEECRAASGHSQVLVTTHSPFFVNGLRPKEVWLLYRDDEGFTRALNAADTKSFPRIPALLEAGAALGQLWMEGAFGVGDPLTNQGAPKAARVKPTLTNLVARPKGAAKLGKRPAHKA